MSNKGKDKQGKGAARPKELKDTMDKKQWSRQQRFSEREKEVLLDNIDANRHILFGSLSSSVTNKLKEEKWELITKKVNAVNVGVPRSVAKMQHKWVDWKSKTKVKAMNIKKGKLKTGRNEPLEFADLSVAENKILDIIGSVALDGEDEGIDTIDDNTLEDNSTQNSDAVPRSTPSHHIATPENKRSNQPHVDTLSFPYTSAGPSSSVTHNLKSVSPIAEYCHLAKKKKNTTIGHECSSSMSAEPSQSFMDLLTNYNSDDNDEDTNACSAHVLSSPMDVSKAPQPQTQRVKTTKKQKAGSMSSEQEIINLERQKIQLMTEDLQVKKEMLKVFQSIDYKLNSIDNKLGCMEQKLPSQHYQDKFGTSTYTAL